MKKIIFFIYFIFISACFTNAQLKINSPIEIPIYKCYYCGFCRGGIWYLKDYGFVLLGETDNQFESSYAHIFLGETKESALTSLYDLYEIINFEKEVSKEFSIDGVNNKNTFVYRDKKNFLIHTSGVAGFSYILVYMRPKFENALEALGNFEIPEVK